MPNLADLPLPVAIMVAAFWIIQQSNAAHAKQLVALVDAFGKEYIALIDDYKAMLQAVSEDRRTASDRWLERDRLLNERLDRNTIAQEKSANETHQLRGVITPLVLSIEAERKRAARGGQSTRGSGGSADAD